MNLFRRPDGNGTSREKVGVAGAIASVLGWALMKYLGVEVPEDVLLAAATILLGLVSWRGRNQRERERNVR